MNFRDAGAHSPFNVFAQSIDCVHMWYIFVRNQAKMMQECSAISLVYGIL